MGGNQQQQEEASAAQVSYVEIYQDDIRDLLGESDGHGAAPALRESPRPGHLPGERPVRYPGFQLGNFLVRLLLPCLRKEGPT